MQNLKTKLIILVVCQLVLIPILLFAQLYIGFMRKRVVDHTRDWQQFYQNQVKPLAYIPPEAKIEQALECFRPTMGESISVNFSLPATKSVSKISVKFVDNCGARSGIKGA